MCSGFVDLKFSSKSIYSKSILVFTSVFLFGFLPVGSAFATSAQLKISGNQIVTASGGCTVRLKGVDMSGLEYSPSGDGGTGAPTTTISGVNMTNYVALLDEAVTVWHVNCIRLPLNQDYWFGCGNDNDNNKAVNTAAYQGMVEAVLNEASNLGAYVDLDLHWSGYYNGTSSTAPCSGGGWGEAGGTCNGCSGQVPLPDWNAVTFWSSVAGTSWVKNNPAALFDLYNEPYEPSGADDNPFWAIWRNGGPVPASTNTGSSSFPAYTSCGLQNLLTAARNAGANNICVAGGLNWSFDERGVPTYGLTDTASGNGILYSAHVYDNKTGNSSDTPPLAAAWDPYITTITNKYAILVEEFGPGTGYAADDNNPTWTNGALNWIDGYNNGNGNANTNNPNGYVYSAMAWDFSPDVTPKLLTSYSGFPTTSYFGAPVSTWLYQLNETPTPNCGGGTATNTPTNTSTNTPTNTPTNSPTHTLTNTPTNTSTNTVTSTPTHTATNTATSTPTNTITNTPVNPATNTPTNSPTKTATKTPTNTSTNTATNTITNTPTISSTPTITNTATNTATGTVLTATATNTATNTPTNTATSTITNTPTNTTTPTITNTPTNTSTGTPTSTVTNTPTNTATNTITETPTDTSTGTKTNTPTNSPTNTSTNTPTNSPTNTLTKTPTNTPTITPTNTKTNTPTSTPTDTPTNTVTNNLTPLPTSTHTNTPTITATDTLTISSVIVVSAPYPSPSNGSPITFNVQVPSPSTITLDVFTLAFRKIYSQTNHGDGLVTFQWDIKDATGIQVSNGLYYVRIHVEGLQSTTKILKVLILR